MIFFLSLSKEIKDVTRALEDLKRELRADLRTPKDSVKYCSDTCDCVKELRNK